MRRASAASSTWRLGVRLVAVGWIGLLLAAGEAAADDRAEQLAAARELARAGRPAEAAAIYQALYEENQDDLSLRFQLAVARHMAGEYGPALEHSRAVAAARPDFAQAWLFVGAALLQSGQSSQAVEPLRTALRLDVADPNARLMLGEALLRTGSYREAAVEFLEASSALEGSARVWYGLERSSAGLLEAALKRLKDDREASDYALALAQGREPRATPDPLADSAAVAYRAGRFSDLLAAEPVDAPAVYWQARVALDLATRARLRLEELPESSQRYELRARDLDARGMSREASLEWRRALELAPDSASLKKGLAAALRLARDCEAALPLLAELRRQEPTSAETHFLEGDCALSLEEPRRAAGLLERALELDPSLTPAAAALGSAYVRLGEFEPAVAALLRARAADQDGSVHYQLARAYRGLGRSKEAREALAQHRRIQEKAAELRADGESR